MMGLLEQPGRLELGGGWSLRLLSAWEELECQGEGEALASEGREAALCANACLLAKALLKRGSPAFADGREVLEKLTAGQIAECARRWGEFDREHNAAPWDEKAVDEAKKAWSTRLMSAFAGACSALLGRCPQKRE